MAACVACTSSLIYLEVHEKRGRKAIDHIGILPERKGTALHDRYTSYDQYEDMQHAFCNAHHLRDLKFIQERYQQSWAFDMENLLLEIKKVVKEAQPAADGLSAQQIADFEARYDAVITAGLQANALLKPALPLPKKRGKLKQHPANNLLDHF